MIDIHIQPHKVHVNGEFDIHIQPQMTTVHFLCMLSTWYVNICYLFCVGPINTEKKQGRDIRLDNQNVKSIRREILIGIHRVVYNFTWIFFVHV